MENIDTATPSQILELCLVDLLPELDVIYEPGKNHGIHQQKRKTTYQCPDCNSKVWGKPKLALACLNCNSVYREA